MKTPHYAAKSLIDKRIARAEVRSKREKYVVVNFWHDRPKKVSIAELARRVRIAQKMVDVQKLKTPIKP